MVPSEEVTVRSGRSDLAGTLFRPADVDRPPVVVMAHGFAARRSWGLPAVAKRFAAEGIAALTFDYRGFGDSGGGPRRVIDPAKQRADYRAAVEYVRARDDLYGDSLGLWGMSFSGGHVVKLAATMNVDAVVAMVPFTDGLHVTAHFLQQAGLSFARDGAEAVLRDAVQVVLNRDPYYVPIVGGPDEFSLLVAPGARAGFEAIIPEDEREAWRNRTAARVLAQVPFYRPITVAGDVQAPVHVLHATDDDIVPPGAIDRLVDALDDVTRVRLPLGHFDGLTGPTAPEVAKRQAEFLASHLR